ncbi:MAG TPA: aspartate--tRNA ligase [Candidatus Ozemobacteraceae bacterium]|nr:aspartate--tRNA ligase [Candidatus Ozemobacteraceae bacterium]
MHTYRTHTCVELRQEHLNQHVRLSGWIHRKRNLGGMVFIDLRDHHGITQILIEPNTEPYATVEPLRHESVITVDGVVQSRGAGNINERMPTGAIEVRATSVSVQSSAEILPFPVSGEPLTVPENTRLTYRFLDLRRQKLHQNIVLRSKIISSLRRRMTDLGFLEYQTPILTSSSPEGARDFLVPSRIHPGKFYALPQAPQQFKQLLMVSGFDRYFQIAPCFRDEDARADRSPGEFYQLDVEMSFVTQDDVFSTIEQVMHGVFSEFSSHEITSTPFPRIPFEEAMRKFGSDKPDLRFELHVQDVTDLFATGDFKVFREVAAQGGVVRCLSVPGVGAKSRKFFDDLEAFARENGAKGLASLVFTGGQVKGSLAKGLSEGLRNQLKQRTATGDDAAILLMADQAATVASVLGKVRLNLADQLDLRQKNCYKFCWITDFPMFERDPESGQIIFSHNPFSMPQGGMEALCTQDPLTIKAFQYDIVCNGIELSSGAIRNHRPDIMYKAFEIAGYKKEDVDAKFGGMIKAFTFGAPPHGGIAPGVDRMVMLLADEPNIREVILFPMNQQAQDLLMGAPCDVTEKQLKELHIQIVPPTKD